MSILIFPFFYSLVFIILTFSFVKGLFLGILINSGG